MIEVQDLVKRYGGYLAVDHLSFSAEKGQIYGFLGPNGAGKSTTMNIMTGCLAPTSGTVIVDGMDLQQEPEKVKQRIGYLPELPPLYPEMTVREYLTFAAKLKKVPRLEQLQQVVQAMSKTGLLEEQDHLIRTLSKGYRQRVGLAATLLGNPDVVILDEPTVGLDPRQILEIRDLIRSLREEHVVILSSHILSEVSAVCDYIFILSHGKLVASDTPENLEAQLHAGGALCASVRATPEEMRTLCSAMLPGIPVEISAGARAGQTELRFGAVDDRVTEDFFYACAEAKKPILKLEREKASLEEIFLELTDDHTDAELVLEREEAGA
ncbi:ABC transporter ATP-binding protein [Butyricicoccus pullicaecorum]|uniref:ABC transporter n=1 Tax=Butyricicoccus pullicaecorum TaxID=501571 RepID=A0A1Y4LU09_9FIRM|nr:ABC transporter ATP-binding protein [Butyricicoccus pullicaecorum]OUP60113.1 ABC transporter [Butyricicoccus pullicaecorum]